MVAAFLILSLMAPAPGEQPVRVWLGTGGPFAPGDRVRVFVQTDVDGYLVVLHRRPDGGVDVLFPGDPKTDPFARAGTYEIRGPEDAPVLAVAGPLGRGTVLAALSPDPFRFAEFVRGGIWNAGALTATWQGDGSGAEASLTDIVQRMLGDGSFNYDLVTYAIAPQAARKPWISRGLKTTRRGRTGGLTTTTGGGASGSCTTTTADGGGGGGGGGGRYGLQRSMRRLRSMPPPPRRSASSKCRCASW